MIRDIIWYGDNRLKEKSETVISVDDEIKTLVSDMYDTMYNANGAGLAAAQVGILKRVIVISIPDFEDETKEHFKLTLINPEIVDHSENMIVEEEGCLSFPNLRLDEVPRYEKVIVKYMDIDGVEQTIEADGFTAKALQHEIDHTNGIVFVDRIDKDQKRGIKQELKELRVASKNRKKL